jgi:hypothetical protein
MDVGKRTCKPEKTPKKFHCRGKIEQSSRCNGNLGTMQPDAGQAYYIHWSEQQISCGLYASLTHVRLVTEYFHMVPPQGGYTATVYCNSKAALKRVQDLEFDGFGTTWQCRANYNMEAAIRSCIQQQPGSRIKWTWVKGHARQRKHLENFTAAEQLNKAVDAMATSARCNPTLARHTISIGLNNRLD